MGQTHTGTTDTTTRAAPTRRAAWSSQTPAAAASLFNVCRPVGGGSGPARGDDGRRGGTPSTRWGEKKANRTPAEGVGTNASPTAAHSAWRLCRAGHRRVRVPSESPPPPLQAKGPTPPAPRPAARGAELAAAAPLRKRGVAPRRFTRCFCPQIVPPQTDESWRLVGGGGGVCQESDEGGKKEPLSKPAQWGDCLSEAPPRNPKEDPSPCTRERRRPRGPTAGPMSGCGGWKGR